MRVYMMQPRAQTSTLGVNFNPLQRSIYSGALYIGVVTFSISSIIDSFSSTLKLPVVYLTVELPKSHITHFENQPFKIFSIFKSLCAIYFACIYDSPFEISAMMPISSASSAMPMNPCLHFSSIRSKSVPCGQYSSNKYTS